MGSRFDQIVSSAAEQAARGVELAAPDHRETALVDAVENALSLPTKREFGAGDLKGWQRTPGGFDLAILKEQSGDSASALMEMKIEKLDESLWDLLKLAGIGLSSRTERTFLVYEAARSTFEGDADCASLFRAEGTETHSVRELIERWPRAWANLLKGGYGNHPLLAPGTVSLSLVGMFKIEGRPTHEIRILAVEAQGSADLRFGADGWPEGFISESTEPASGPRDRASSAVDKASREAPYSNKPMIPGRITQSWLVSNVPSLDDGEFELLLAELKRRNWNSREIDERVWPLRSEHAEPGPQLAEPSQAPVPVQDSNLPEVGGAQSTPRGEEPRLAGGPSRPHLPELIESVLGAVVQIAAPTDEGISQGSGFAIDPLRGHEDYGIFVTNHHVIDGANAVVVHFKEDDFLAAQVIASHEGLDLAILMTRIPNRQTLPIKRLDEVRVGEEVIAVGSPRGLSRSVTTGIVSALGRDLYEVHDAIQTSALINPGNSGGPLIAMDGSVIGVNTANRIDSVGLSFAVPAETALRFYANSI